MNMTQNYRDPIVELLNNESEVEKLDTNDPSLSDDIQYINRESSFNHPTHLTPILNQQSLYTTSESPNGFDFPNDSDFNFDDRIQELDQTPSEEKSSYENKNEEQPTKPEETQQPTGLTPLFIEDIDKKIEHQELVPQDYQLISQQYNNRNTQQHNFDALPPLQPLSESIIPNGINIKPLILPDMKNDSNHHQQQQLLTANPKRKKESTGPKARPAFVMKIWSMVNDPKNSQYIRWNSDGKTFQVFHREDFMKVILPKYFKHNNFASFVRQLNMYGWHKVQDINNGTLNSNCEKNGDGGGNDEIWQFENPNFLRDREDLLEKIVRNKSNSNQDEMALNENINNHNANISMILQELENIKMNQFTISEELRRIRQDNKTLWQENYLNRERNEIQGGTLDKILKFLSVVYGNNANKILDLSNSNIKNGGSVNPNPSNEYSMTQYNSPIMKRAKTSPPEDFLNKSSSYRQPETSYKNKHKENLKQQRYRLMLTDQEYSNSKRPSVSKTKSTPGSIEEIIRSYDTDKSSENNVNRIYQQLIDQDKIPSTKLSDMEIPSNSKSYDEIESSIEKSGQSLQQVQDWIEKLNSEPATGDLTNSNEDDFDVNEFLQNTTPGASISNVNSPVVITPGSNDGENPKKRTIEEVYDNE